MYISALRSRTHRILQASGSQALSQYGHRDHFLSQHACTLPQKVVPCKMNHMSVFLKLNMAKGARIIKIITAITEA